MVALSSCAAVPLWALPLSRNIVSDFEKQRTRKRTCASAGSKARLPAAEPDFLPPVPRHIHPTAPPRSTRHELPAAKRRPHTTECPAPSTSQHAAIGLRPTPPKAPPQLRSDYTISVATDDRAPPPPPPPPPEHEADPPLQSAPHSPSEAAAPVSPSWCRFSISGPLENLRRVSAQAPGVPAREKVLSAKNLPAFLRQPSAGPFGVVGGSYDCEYGGAPARGGKSAAGVFTRARRLLLLGFVDRWELTMREEAEEFRGIRTRLEKGTAALTSDTGCVLYLGKAYAADALASVEIIQRWLRCCRSGAFGRAALRDSLFDLWHGKAHARLQTIRRQREAEEQELTDAEQRDVEMTAAGKRRTCLHQEQAGRAAVLAGEDAWFGRESLRLKSSLRLLYLKGSFAALERTEDCRRRRLAALRGWQLQSARAHFDLGFLLRKPTARPAVSAISQWWVTCRAVGYRRQLIVSLSPTVVATRGLRQKRRRDRRFDHNPRPIPSALSPYSIVPGTAEAQRDLPPPGSPRCPQSFRAFEDEGVGSPAAAETLAEVESREGADRDQVELSLMNGLARCLLRCRHGLEHACLFRAEGIARVDFEGVLRDQVFSSAVLPCIVEGEVVARSLLERRARACFKKDVARGWRIETRNCAVFDPEQRQRCHLAGVEQKAWVCLTAAETAGFRSARVAWHCREAEELGQCECDARDEALAAAEAELAKVFTLFHRTSLGLLAREEAAVRRSVLREEHNAAGLIRFQAVDSTLDAIDRSTL
ncbi:hypothetical protein DIPPA_27196 [Diplonema papillatum]|nr:hypothetical protein DIPPA_27196 [Diplonema papillatum]